MHLQTKNKSKAVINFHFENYFFNQSMKEVFDRL